MAVLSEKTILGILQRIAYGSGVAAAITNGGQEHFAANNNSICSSLNPDGEYSPACAAFCGRAREVAENAGGTASFVCHAGLKCRAAVIPELGDKAVVAGRTFPNSAAYRNATTRAMTGDWQHLDPVKLFENAPIEDSDEVIDRTANMIAAMITKAALAAEPPVKAEEQILETPPFDRPAEEPVREPVPPPAAEIAPPAAEESPSKTVFDNEKERRDAAEWRSFIATLSRMEYREAAEATLEMAAERFKIDSLVWLDRTGDTLQNLSARGALSERRITLNIRPNDPRLAAAAHTRRPLELGERARDGKQSTRTLQLFPLGSDDTVNAAIGVFGGLKHENDAVKLSGICASLAPQIEILRLRDEVRRRDEISRAVRRFSDSLKQVDREDLWTHVAQSSAEMIGAERASIFIHDDRTGSLKLRAVVGAVNEFDIDLAGERVAEIVFEKAAPLIVPDVAKTGLPSVAERGYKTRSFLACPITLADRTLGVICFADRVDGSPFTRSSLDLFLMVAPQLAVAVDRAALKDIAGEFEQLSVTDPLTGLLNRRYIEARLEEEIKRSNRHGFPMSFLMLDVDHFKSYNDTFGHPAGDEALKLVGHVIRETLRGADVAARYGGEEFSILLPQTPGHEAAAIAERIRANIENTKFPHRQVTTSIGVASCSAELCAAGPMVDAADKALYEAKRLGRNRVQAFEAIAPDGVIQRTYG
ncbi:MAG: sensor domain-containing diguanylate cyclase [Acidobacteriota bacterium]|nr:MAG: sensor domain-containing diguanylate cyclase [Acidobacteriota bacterium]